MIDLDLIVYNSTGDMTVQFNSNNGAVSGTDNLIQRIIKRIFTVQGSNTYDPHLGSQFDKLFQAITHEEAEEFKETFSILLETVKDQILEEQTEYMSELADSEILVDVTVFSMVYDPIFGGFLITLQVTTANNAQIVVTLT